MVLKVLVQAFNLEWSRRTTLVTGSLNSRAVVAARYYLLRTIRMSPTHIHCSEAADEMVVTLEVPTMEFLAS